jgi:hypothetical protein
MNRWLPDPVAFSAATLFLLFASLAFALHVPEVRIWLEEIPVGFGAMVGGFSGLVIGLLVLLMGILYNAEVNRSEVRDRRRANARALAAAIRGEIVAMANWTASQAAHLQENNPPRDNDAQNESMLNESMPNEWLGSTSLPARPVYESNANRLHILGGALSEAVSYTYAYLEQAQLESDRPNMSENSVELRLNRLQNAEATAGVLAKSLRGFVAGKPVSNDLPATLQDIYEKTTWSE